ESCLFQTFECFLLCTKAGGLGINLTAADYVIIYDCDWNPQNDLQAQARCHSIGQQKMVKVYRLLCRNTYEREMFDKASLKLGLDKAVLQSMNTAQGGKEINNKPLSKKEIEDLLKKGAYGSIMEEDSAADKFCEEDIDQILERRTQIITPVDSSGIRTDIDIDDSDFWKKWAKKADIDTAERGDKNELVISEPQRRTQIKRYGHDEAVMDMSNLESSSGDEDNEDNDTTIGVGRGRGNRKHKKLKKLKQKYFPEDFVIKEEEVTYGAWPRSECFKVERGLLTEGWKESDVEDVARIIMLYCLRYYRGDDKISSFIWDLITPVENGESAVPRNHLGLHSPVPRGGRRKMKLKMKETRLLSQTSSEPTEMDHWSRHDKYDGDIFLESNYRKHLARHANKVLFRVRMLYYIKHEILGDLVHHISDGQNASALPIYPPHCDQAPAPCDPALIFLARCGPPTHTVEEKELGKLSDDGDGSETTAAPGPDDLPSEPATPNPSVSGEEGGQTASDEDPNKPQWPSMQDFNSRLRRVITSYQRNFKKEELKLAQKAKKVERTEKYERIVRERERQRMEVNQKKWSRREEQDLYKTVSTYGVDFDRQKNRFEWTKFRTMSRLEKKFDDTMTEYYKAFVAMCKRVCCMKLTEEEECTELYVEPLPEDKARRTMERINLLSKIREEILPHPQLDERLRLCQVSAGGCPVVVCSAGSKAPQRGRVGGRVA
ncbi:choline dehydrogenase 7, partial [Homalodisca vitripennis]